MLYKPELFFDLSNFKWRGVFENCENAWEALQELDQWLIDYFWKKIGVNAGLDEDFLCKEEDVIFKAGVFYKGRILIGKGSEIRSGAYLLGPLIIGENCVIRSEVENSILLNNVNADHPGYIGNSIVGNDVHLGAGVVLANSNFKNLPVRVGEDNARLEKLGAIIGDGSQIGCNAVLNPGVVIGKNSFVYPNDVLSAGLHSEENLLRRFKQKAKEA